MGGGEREKTRQTDSPRTLEEQLQVLLVDLSLPIQALSGNKSERFPGSSLSLSRYSSRRCERQGWMTSEVKRK